MKQSPWRWYDYPIAGLMYIVMMGLVLLPQSWLMPLARILGDGLQAAGYRRRVMKENLTRAGYVDIKALMRANYRHYACYILEVLRMGRSKRAEWRRQNVRWHDMHYVDQALRGDSGKIGKVRSKGKGVFILTAHLGNYDYLAAIGAYTWPLSIVSKPVKLRSIEWAWMSQRGSSGLNILLNSGSMRDILQVLRRNEMLGFVLDQHARNGVVVPFFNRPAKTLDSLAVLAVKTGAPVVPVFTYRDNTGKHVVQSYPPIPLPTAGDRAERVLAATTLFTAAIETAVREHPEQWTWVHRRWKVDC